MILTMMLALAAPQTAEAMRPTPSPYSLPEATPPRPSDDVSTAQPPSTGRLSPSRQRRDTRINNRIGGSTVAPKPAWSTLSQPGSGG